MNSQTKVLVVEDDHLLGEAIRAALLQAGYAADWINSGDLALTALRSAHFDAVILDIMLPHQDGLSVLRELRSADHSIPVIIVSARDRAEHRVQGLDAGADDYLVKPFNLDELLARLRARLRRGPDRVAQGSEASGIRVDAGGRTATRDDAPLVLTAREFKVLNLLVRRAGRFVSKDEIEETLYEASAELQSNTVESAIYGLRRKIGAELIITARGLGYMIPK